MREFWNFRNGTEEEGRVLTINGAIAEESWLDDDVTPKDFRQQLMGGTGKLTVYINSPGGDCIAASQIYTMLTEYPSDVTVKIDGIAASAASVIAMAGDTVLMSPTALIMIHDPLTMVYGNRDDMKKAIDVLAQVKESIINAYKKKSGCSRDEISDMMSKETWMNARKAISLGFADGIIGGDTADINDMQEIAFANRIVGEKIVAKLKEKTPAGRNIADLQNRLENIKTFM